jgi:DNA mismatch repair ATPase MutS
MKRVKIYKQKIEQYNNQGKVFSGKILRLSILRLTIFGISVVGVYFLWLSALWITLIVLAFFASFVYLVKKHAELKEERAKTKLLIEINKNEIEAVKGNFSHFETGAKHKEADHAYAEDIDLFGKKSFFQYLDRTGLQMGQDILANLLKSNATQNIVAKQEATKELSKKLDFRQHFTAEAKMLEDQDKLKEILSALQNHKSFVPKYLKILGYIFSLLSLVVVALYAFGIIGEMQLLLWIFVGLGITGAFLKKVNNLSLITSKAQEIFRQYQKLISTVENEEFESQLLKNQQTQLITGKLEASSLMKQFSKYIDSLEQRQNFLVGFVLNALFLWDLQQSHKIEGWLAENKQSLEKWFTTIAEFDALNSLGNLAFNETEFCYPTIQYDSSHIIKCDSGCHPLIPKNRAIANDFSIHNEDFLIITGANMAGKSTFLRTVSLMVVMSNVGLPVCAKTCLYSPIKLITSMRTSDSLSDEASYFYSELSRLKTIVEHIKKDKYFIVLDEILKGTNSHDKAKGSQQFIEKLVKSKSSGIIATHDLSLCSLSEKLDSVYNYYFDAEIKDDDLYFDYKFKRGICQNMNASFLLKKMEIV